MNDSKNILSNSSNHLMHIIYHQSIPDQFVLDWQKENKFDINCDYQTFLKFVKINFNVDFEFVDPKNLSKGKWVSTRENDIMLMETQKDKLLCQYIKSYNDYVSIDKGDLMPRFTLECRKLFLEQNKELEKLKAILDDNGIEIKNISKKLEYTLESNIFSPGDIKILKFLVKADVKAISGSDTILKIEKLESKFEDELEFNIHALKTGDAKLIFIAKNFEPLEIHIIVN